jgi:drug/metabolite transporter (DMT)-like permease
MAMIAFLPFIGQRLPTARGELGHLAVMGLINAGLPIFLISWGESVGVDSGTAGVLNSLTPIFSLIIAGLLLRTEVVTPLRIAGVLIGFGGAFVLTAREINFSAEGNALLGAIAVVIAAASYAAGASYARHRIRYTHRYVVAGGTLLFAAVYATLAALVLEGGISVPTQADTLIAVGWLGLLGSFVAYLLYFFLIAQLGATGSTMVTYVFPLVAVALGVAFLREALDWTLVLGTMLVLAGIATVTLRYDSAVIRVARATRR